MLPLILSAITPIVSDLIDRAFPDSEKREQARLEVYAKMQESMNSLDLAQMEVNKAEASNVSIFVAGWRPAVGWCCAGAFAYHYIIQPFLLFMFAVFGKTVPLPVFDMESLLTVLLGMLGLGGMRTFEKVKGVTQGLSGKLPWQK